MFSQQVVYFLGLLNLILAGIAIFCVTQAENHPEYFSLVYIAVSIFIFYMGTILVIITLQIIETCQEQHQRNLSSLEIQTPVLKTQIVSQSHVIINERIARTMKPKIQLIRSQTLPLNLSSYSPHHALPSTLEDSIDTSSEIQTTATCVSLVPKTQQTFSTTYKNYQSFAFITNDYRHPLS
jgi:hypothetical protein